jgi:hypothetical protein
MNFKGPEILNLLNDSEAAEGMSLTFLIVVLHSMLSPEIWMDIGGGAVLAGMCFAIALLPKCEIVGDQFQMARPGEGRI